MLPDEIDTLVHELSASLLPSQRHAFIDAAHQALQGVSCLGPGLAFRLLAEIQRRHFEPPDLRSDMMSARHQRSKLRDGPPIGADDPRVGGRDRRQFQAG
jgi:hypothetical protein